jgi:hypothetical protein
LQAAQAAKLDEACKATGEGKGGRASGTPITTDFEKTGVLMGEYAEIHNLPAQKLNGATVLKHGVTWMQTYFEGADPHAPSPRETKCRVS